jgi:hypothetical protein
LIIRYQIREKPAGRKMVAGLVRAARGLEQPTHGAAGVPAGTVTGQGHGHAIKVHAYHYSACGGRDKAARGKPSKRYNRRWLRFVARQWFVVPKSTVRRYRAWTVLVGLPAQKVMMSRIRNSHSKKNVQAPREVEVAGPGNENSLFERIGRQVAFAPADARVLQELAGAAQTGLTEAAAALEREVFGTEDADGAWLPRVLGEPGEEMFREAVRGLREAAGRAPVPQALVAAGLAGLPLRLEEVIRGTFGRSGRKGRAAQAAAD